VVDERHRSNELPITQGMDPSDRYVERHPAALARHVDLAQLDDLLPSVDHALLFDRVCLPRLEELAQMRLDRFAVPMDPAAGNPGALCHS
jgi:hypothetical protein